MTRYKTICRQAHHGTNSWQVCRPAELDQSQADISVSTVARKVTDHEFDVWWCTESLALEKDFGHSTGLDSAEIRVLSTNIAGQAKHFTRESRSCPYSGHSVRLAAWHNNAEVERSELGSASIFPLLADMQGVCLAPIRWKCELLDMADVGNSRPWTKQITMGEKLHADNKLVIQFSCMRI